MIKKAPGTFLLLLVSITTFTTLYSFIPVKASASIQLLYDYGFFDPSVGYYGAYNVIGEVKNIGDKPAINVNVTVTFYKDEAKNIPITTKTAQTYLNYVAPEKKAPFRLALSEQQPDGTLPIMVKSYTIKSITFNEIQESKPLNLQIVNSTFYLKDGAMKITGAIKNNGEAPALDTQAIISYYNKSSGNIFWASRGIALPSNLTYGRTAYFEVTSYPKKIVPEQCDVVVLTESKEYVSEPTSNIFRDLIKPKIEDPIWSPNPPTSIEIVGVNVTVIKPDYASKVTQVTLYYRAGRETKQKNMIGYETNRTGFKDLWRSTIDMFGAGQTVQFWFVAFDDAGNNATSKIYSYTVASQTSPGTPPEILLIAFIVLVLIIVVIKYRKKLF